MIVALLCFFSAESLLMDPLESRFARLFPPGRLRKLRLRKVMDLSGWTVASLRALKNVLRLILALQMGIFSSMISYAKLHCQNSGSTFFSFKELLCFNGSGFEAFKACDLCWVGLSWGEAASHWDQWGLNQETALTFEASAKQHL